MTANLLPILRGAGPPIANHLWQSTAFVLAVSLLALLFARNRARVRYGLWLAASLKFLIPFSALIALGSVIPMPRHAAPSPSVISIVHAVNQPFSAPAVTQAANSPSSLERAEARLPAALILTWFLGFAAVLLAWYLRWRQISRMLRRSVPAEKSREAEILRRIRNATSARTPIRLLVSSDLMEPGVFGIFSPALLWPAQLSHCLEDSHLQAILAHEVAHVQRRDNLTALMQMLVEAIFWFHPFVWWIERKMVEERERACDEAVVQSGSRAEIYADSLLKVSRFCAELPLPCVSGITGADLSKRIRSIMLPRFTDLGMGKRLLLAAFAISVVAAPVSFGLMQDAPQASQILHATGPLPSFEVASIRQDHSGSRSSAMGAMGIHAPKDRFIATNATIMELIQWAWSPRGIRPLADDQVSGGPNWTNFDRFDIDAKLDDSQLAALEKLALLDRFVQMKLMVQSLLADRFKLVLNDTTVTVPAYALVVAKGGSKLQETVQGSTPAPGTFPAPPPPGTPPTISQGPLTRPEATIRIRPGAGKMIAFDQPVSALAKWLRDQLGRPVLDQTGLKGNYNFELKWTPDLNSPETTPGPSPATETAPPDASGPSLFTAIQEQLGLKLESTKAPEEAISIVHIEKPSEN
jgi:bla regulator protein blaR1